VSARSTESVDAPDFAEPIEAWRIWRVVIDKRGCWLGSIVKPTLWPSGDALVADCLRAGAVGRRFRRWRRKSHAAPTTNCECGIYGTGLRECGQYLNDSPLDERGTRVLGQVSLWGTVIECERGFRASHAYPLRIYVPADSSSRSAQRWEESLAGLEVYGVPVEFLSARRSEAIEVLEQMQPAGLRSADGGPAAQEDPLG
jgi:hypothetical protein